jgi:hypothetical protein
MREPVLDADTFTQFGSAGARLEAQAQLLLKSLVVAHRDAAPSPVAA